MNWQRENESLWSVSNERGIYGEAWLGQDGRWHVDAHGGALSRSYASLRNAKRGVERWLRRPE